VTIFIVMKLLNNFIKSVLKEDVTGFAKEMSAYASQPGLSDQDGWYDEFEMHLSKGTGRAIKSAFRNNADHQWLKTLDTVHWKLDAYSLTGLKGKNRDELSVVMYLPSEPFRSIRDRPFGLWVKGRITLAAPDMDNIWSGHYAEYMSNDWGAAPSEEQTHRARSSGINKRPLKGATRRNYDRLGQYLKNTPDSKINTKLLRTVTPYIFDQESWNAAEKSTGTFNEALVDNWKLFGIVVTDSGLVSYLRRANLEGRAIDTMSGVVGPGCTFGPGIGCSCLRPR
jgi:hypothetical protein